jgi:hypothetical protein
MKYVISRFFKFTYILNNNNNQYLHIYTQFLTNIQETKQQQLTISISTINDTDYFGKGISIYFFVIIFRL